MAQKKHLLILRHGKASSDDPTILDHNRPLNKRGRRQGVWLGQLLVTQGLEPELILCSTSLRTRTTVELLTASSGYAGPLHLLPELYLAEAGAYLQALEKYAADFNRVMVVGHNPGLEDLLAGLIGKQQTLTTANLAVVEMEGPEWSPLGRPPRGKQLHLWRPARGDE